MKTATLPIFNKSSTSIPSILMFSGVKEKEHWLKMG